MCFDTVLCVCHWHLHGKGCKLLPQQTARSQNFSKLLKLLCVEVLEVCGYCRIRPTLLLVHGSAASLTQYLPLAAALNETPGSTSFHFLCQSHGGFWYDTTHDMTILTYPDQMYLWSHFYYLCIWSHWPFSLEIEGAGRNSRTTPLTHHCLLPTTSSVESKTTYIFLVFIYVRHHVTVGLGWTLLLRGLRTLGYGIVCYDWLGCGGSEKPDCRGCTNQGGVTWPWSPIDLRTCSTPHHVFFCVSFAFAHLCTLGIPTRQIS